MKQVVQYFNTGESSLESVPAPTVRPQHLLIKTQRSLVSLGTERMLVSFAKAGFIGKARQQPDKVKQLIQKLKTDGIRPSLEAVYRKLNKPFPLGYCNAGVVIEVGEGVKGFKVGDRVASNGPHAEFVCVPQNLCARIPDKVDMEAAAFTVTAAISLQGIRLLKPSLGERVVVTGLGLVGLLAAQLLKANGCNVVGLDIDPEKIKLAQKLNIPALNASDPSIQNQLKNIDAVLITAATDSNGPIEQAAQISRKKGRIVLTGVTGMQLNRRVFFEKELSFQVSCSYGPGRYDAEYEEKGHDYPQAYVRWTAQRNFEAVLQLMANGNLDVKSLISERVALNDFHQIYDEMESKEKIASLLIYDESATPERQIFYQKSTGKAAGARIGIIGAGNYVQSKIAPILYKQKAQLKWIASAGGLTAASIAKQYGIEKACSDYKEMLQDNETDAVIIATQHHLHAQILIETLEAGKAVFVEKPLCINAEELENVKKAFEKYGGSIMVGFNRRFAPLVQKLKILLKEEKAIAVTATMNAGHIPADSWVQDLERGGGRLVGEACHLVDLLQYLTGSLVVESNIQRLQGQPDVATIQLLYENGSVGTVNYFANGHRNYPKERIEVYASGKTAVIDNFRGLQLYGFNARNKNIAQDKGQKAQFRAYLDFLEQGGEVPISFESIVNTMEVVLGLI